jgi:hypothetical protein
MSRPGCFTKHLGRASGPDALQSPQPPKAPGHASNLIRQWGRRMPDVRSGGLAFLLSGSDAKSERFAASLVSANPQCLGHVDMVSGIGLFR